MTIPTTLITSKSDLIAGIAAEHDLAKAKASDVVDGVLAAIVASLKAGNEVRLQGFGTFTVTERKATTGRNPRTGETIQIAAKRGVKFKASKVLGDAVNG